MLQSLVIFGCLLSQTDPVDATKYAPIYGASAAHPWDAVHKSFFLRSFTTGETYYHRHSFDVPWHFFRRLSNQDAEYQALLTLLDAVDQLPRDEMEQAAPTRRLIFFRDLWTVFECLERMESKERAKTLRHRLARIMRRLELTDDEIRKLPDTLKFMRGQARFPESPDPEHPEKPFLPTTLLSDPAEWIPISTSKKAAFSAPHHTASASHRSLFSIHFHWPEGRTAGEKFIAANPLQDYLKFPPGTRFALLRRALAANTEGKLQVTNVVESLQLLVTPPANGKEDARFKFVFDRAEFLSGKPGLMALDANSPVDAFGFESTGQWAIERKDDADGETLVLGRGKGHVGIPSLQHCVACHGLQNARFHVNFSQFPVYTSNNSDLASKLPKVKEESESWRDYLRLRGS